MGTNTNENPGDGKSGSSKINPSSNTETPLSLKKPMDAVAVTESFSVRSPAADASPNVSHMGEQALDYIGTSQAIKSLFSLPYAPDKSVSVGIHNVDGCLLIDADPSLTQETEPTAPRTLLGELQDTENGHHAGPSSTGAGPYYSPENNNNNYRAADSIVALPPLSPVPAANSAQQSAALSALNSMMLEERAKKKKEEEEKASSQLSLREKHSSIRLAFESTTPSDIPASAATTEPREYVHWDFHDIKMLVGSDAYVYRSSPDASLAVRVEDATDMRHQLSTHENMKKQGLFTPGYDNVKRSYADALRAKQLRMEEEEKESEDHKKDGQSENTPSSAPSFAVPNLDQVQLQTCIVPSMMNLNLGGMFSTTNAEPPPSLKSSSSPVCTVIDAYLDNIIANVPQLALCLREKGFVQSVKLLSTEELPSAFMQEKTFDTSTPFEVITDSSAKTKNMATTNSNGEQIFSPAIMDMNASTLLRFLKANCTKDNATYLLHREAGQTNIQLYDVSSISNQRQRKWLWWLATMSYRFALRLRHLSMHMAKEASSASKETLALQRTFRARSRSLLQNTLSLLEELADTEGPMHENFRAEVCEKIAESFLHNNDEVNATKVHKEPELPGTNIPTPATSSDPSQRLYKNVPADSLVKAQDYLSIGIKTLWKAQRATCQEMDEIAEGKAAKSRKERRRQKYAPKNDSNTAQQQSVRVISIHGDSSSSEDDEDNAVPSDLERSLQFKSEAIATQLYSLHETLINVSLRLAEYHLNGYWSSSLMQDLRTTARRMADAISLFEPLERSSEEIVGKHLILSGWRHSLQLQYTRLWELSGHFARSFAADDLWRDRGHAAGDDVISVLRDVEAAFPYSSHVLNKDSGHSSESTPQVSVAKSLFQPSFDWLAPDVTDVVETETKGFDGDLTGIVNPENTESHLSGTMDDADLDAAKTLLEAKKQLQRDRRRVLVAAALSYKRAIVVYEGCRKVQNDGEEPGSKESESQGPLPDCALLNLLRQRLGDSCNEIGKVLLNELRTVLAASQNQEAADEEMKAKQRAAEPFLSSAEFWFSRGIQAFEGCKDLRNAALLRANVCQCYKLRANAVFATSTKVQTKSHSSSSEKATHAEVCLQEAADHLQAAHESLGERDVDPNTWDMISNELAATYLVLGVRRRQSLLGGGSAPLLLHAVRLSPGQERSILSPMEKALTIYEQSGNLHQAAAVQYQLALFYSKIWTCQRDEAKTREKLSAAFEHFKASHSYFFHSILGNEPTFVLLSLDICNLYATVSGEECLKQALLRCLDTMDAFSKNSIDVNLSPQQKSHQAREEWLEKMNTLAPSVEDRLFKTIRSLVKLEESAANSSGSSSQDSDGNKYKELYRVALSSKMSAPNAVAAEQWDDSVKNLSCLYKILQAVQAKYSSLSS